MRVNREKSNYLRNNEIIKLENEVVIFEIVFEMVIHVRRIPKRIPHIPVPILLVTGIWYKTTVLKIVEKKIRITMGSFMKATDSWRLLELTRTGISQILKYLKHRSWWWFFINSNNHTTLVKTLAPLEDKLKIDNILTWLQWTQ